MRLQADLAEKLKHRREQRLNKLADKHMKEKANFLQKSEKSTNSADFSAVSRLCRSNISRVVRAKKCFFTYIYLDLFRSHPKTSV